MNCPNCGVEVEDGACFCTECGCGLLLAETSNSAVLDPGNPATSEFNIPVAPETSIPATPELNASAGAPSKTKAPLIVGIVCTLIIVVVLAVVLIPRGTGNSIPTVSDSTKTPRNAQESPDGGTSITGLVVFEDDDSDDEPLADESPNNGELSTDESPGLDDVEVRPQLSDYSWDELAKIATRLESCDQEGEALRIAQNYKLVESSGLFPRSTKEIATLDGKVLHMRLVGVWHDVADTASGKAGLSFLCDGIITRHAMDDATTVPGGWESSAMRYWLNNDFLHTIPSEVSDHIVPVRKKTNNEGATRTVLSVTETLDSLWLPSIMELCGSVKWVFESNSENSDIYNAVFNAEGAQYAAFAQETIDDFAENQIFSLGGEWWLRSIAPAGGKGRYVNAGGDPSYYGDANELRGVVIGFCL